MNLYDMFFKMVLLVNYYFAQKTCKNTDRGLLYLFQFILSYIYFF